MNIPKCKPAKGIMLCSMTIPVLALCLWTGFADKGDNIRPGVRIQQGEATNSSPIALTHDNRFVWTVNPDNNSVTVLNVANDANVKLRELRVGQEPRNLAITPDDRKIYVTNMVGGTVSVIDAIQQRVLRVIPVGTEPFGCALTPDGTKLYVTNFGSETVSVIDTATDRVATTISNVGKKPRGVAITLDGKVYVTQLQAQIRDDSRTIEEKEGRDDGKEGRLTVISSATDTVLSTAVLEPLAFTGFRSNGSTLDRQPVVNPPVFNFDTGAFPNLLQGLAVKGNRLYLPNTASSPNGPFRFNVNVQGFLSVLDTTSDLDSGQTINMNRGIQFEVVGKRLFITNPIAIAFKHNAEEGYVVSAATNRLVKVNLDGTGTPTINAPAAAGDPGNVVRVEVGKNPLGVVINSNDTRAYVMNYISRDVSVVDLSAATPVELARIAAANLPQTGTQAAVIHRGHELFVTSIGPEGTQENSLTPAGRMSDFGWGTCYSCHPDGRADGVTWIFPDGPRQSISMENTGENPQPQTSRLNANGAPQLPQFHQRWLNWSAVRDEVQDFELNIRGVSGGQGLIVDGQGVFNFVPTANTGRSADLDAIAAYNTQGIRAPISPLRPRNVNGQILQSPDVIAGRALFASANCQTCHGGVNWTRSRVDVAPPPLNETIVGGQIVRVLFNVGTFNANAINELKANQAANTQASGVLGFNIPSLRSVYASAPYLHSGSAPTLDDALLNVTHRSAGTGGVDTLSNATDRARVVEFLKSIDARTPVFP